MESKPMNDQIRAAADRLRRIEIGDPFEDVYAGFGNFDGMTLRMLEDRTAVLDFALAQLPADSDTLPITAEWLREVGFEWNEEHAVFYFNYRWMQLWIRTNGQWWLYETATFGGRVCGYDRKTTRGQLLALASVLGITLARKDASV